MYQPYLYRQCMSILKDPYASEDACMDVFIKLNNALLKTEIQNFDAWLYRLTRNHCLRILKEKSKLILMDTMRDEVDEQEDLPELIKYVERLPECIDLLKEDQRRCIVLFYLERRSYKEIESITNYNQNKIRSAIQHGKKNLKKYLLQYERESL